MAHRLLLKIGSLCFIIVVVFQCFSYSFNGYFASRWNSRNVFNNPKSKVVQDLRNLKHVTTPKFIVHSKDKNCTKNFPASLKDSLNLLLNMKTDEATELILHRLGLPAHTTSIDDLIIPEYAQKNISSKIPTIVCAASSNHFPELQALFYHIDTKIRKYFPDIKVVFYDIGLTAAEKNKIIEYGRVEYRLFNFDLYPPHVKTIHLCAWKPIIIQEVLRQVGYVYYMDTSIRLHADQLQKHFNHSERTGHIFRSTAWFNTVSAHTFAPTFTFFNVPPCLFFGLPELESGQIFMRTDSLVSLIIMRSFLTCALQQQCIMPPGAENRTSCSGPKINHLCHREDQSALGIGVYLIYHEFNKIPIFDVTSFETKRGDRSNYLLNLKKTVTMMSNIKH